MGVGLGGERNAVRSELVGVSLLSHYSSPFTTYGSRWSGSLEVRPHVWYGLRLGCRCLMGP